MAATSYGIGRQFVHPALLRNDLSVGGLTFDYADVASYELGVVTERDWSGQLLCAAVYGLASALFLIGVMLGSLDGKFLIAVVFLAAISAMSMIDALGTRPVTVYRLDMILFDGRQVSFVDGDEAVVDELTSRIDAARHR